MSPQTMKHARSKTKNAKKKETAGTDGCPGEIYQNIPKK